MRRYIMLILASLMCLQSIADKRNRDNAVAVTDSKEAVDPLMRLAGNIHQFNEIFPQEKVYLEFDNTAYFQGEVIWFKAFVTHATTLKRGPSKVLYVDLISPGGLVLERLKLKVTAGQADGCFPLQDVSTGQSREKRGMINYPSGYYEIRAYTQNMLDFDPDAMFTRVFPIYTRPKHYGDFDNSSVVEEKHPEVQPVRPESQDPDRKINVSFYPEGGQLVVGLPGKVAFKATGPDGNGIDGSIMLPKNGSDDSQVPVIHDGMGVFEWTPTGTAGSSMRFVNADGKDRRFSLPHAVRSGYSMMVAQNSDSTLKARIYRTPDRTEEALGLAVSCRGELIHFDRIDGKDSVMLDIDCSSWPMGVCRMTLYSEQGEIMSSRSLFHNNSNFEGPQLEIIQDSITHTAFGAQSIGLKLTDSDGEPLHDRFCISVRDPHDYGNGNTDNLLTNLLLASDLKGYIRDPMWYFESDDSLHRQSLDLLTLVQGWERYTWEYTTGQRDFRERHRIEDSLTANGWVLSFIDREPVEDITVLASVVPQDKTKFEMFEYLTDTLGYYGFDLTDFYEKARMNISLVSHRKSGKVKHNSRTRIQMERAQMPDIRPYDALEKDLLEQNWKRYDPSAEQKKKSHENTPTVLFDTLGILLDDVDIVEKRQFIDYDTYNALDAQADTELELDMGEYSSDVFQYLLDHGYNFYQPVFYYVHDQQKVLDKKPFDSPTAIDMIDVKSIIVYDDAMYMKHINELAPLLEEYHRKHMDIDYFVQLESDWTRYRLVDILIKNENELLSYKDIRNLSKRTTTIDGFSRKIEFYSPQYPNGPVMGDIDTRRTIYWNPNVVTDQEGKATIRFYNNSFSTQFQINAAGITGSGTPYVHSGVY